MSKGPQLKGKLIGEKEILTREEALQILSEMATKGSVTAAVALERALRHHGPPMIWTGSWTGSSAAMNELHQDAAIAIAETLERCSLAPYFRSPAANTQRSGTTA